MRYISAAYFPASLVYYPMESHLGYRPGVSSEVFACLDDEQVNVYRDVCRQLVLSVISKERPEVVGVSIGTQMQLIAGFNLLQNDQGGVPGYSRHGRRERDYAASGRLGETGAVFLFRV